MRIVLAVALCLSSLALAQEAVQDPSEPPIVPAADAQIPERVVPANPPLPADPGQDISYAQRCFAVPGQVWIPLPTGRYSAVSASSTAPLSSFHASAPVGPTTSGSGSSGSSGSSGGSSGSSGGGLGDGKAILVLAVVIIAALPVVVYALDEDAPAVVEQRFHCPTFGFDAIGGADFGSFGVAPAGSGRVNFGFAYFGSDFQFDLSTTSITSYSGHLLLRIAPKAHIQPNVALGFRYMSFGGRARPGFEVGVPHRYVFWRSGLREFGLELRPTFMFGLGTFDVGLEAAIIVPMIEPLQLRIGGKVQSFGNEVIGGMNAGLTFTL